MYHPAIPSVDVKESGVVLRYVLALTISAALHAVIWQFRHTTEPSTRLRTKPPAIIDVMMVTPPRPLQQPAPPHVEPKPVPPEPVKPPPPPIPPPKIKPAIQPKKAPPAPPRPVAVPRAAPVQQSAPVIAAEPVATPTPPAPAPAPVVPVQPRVESYTEARHDAAYLNNPRPEYPAMARRRSLEGKVILKVQVMAGGQPGQIMVETGSGYEVLDEAAQETVRHWRFVPAKRGDRPVDSWVRVPIVFKLSH